MILKSPQLKLEVRNDNIMLYPEPKCYTELAASNRLQVQPRSTYQHTQTTRNVIGIQFYWRPVYTGRTFQEIESKPEV